MGPETETFFWKKFQSMEHLKTSIRFTYDKLVEFEIKLPADSLEIRGKTGEKTEKETHRRKFRD